MRVESEHFLAIFYTANVLDAHCEIRVVDLLRKLSMPGEDMLSRTHWAKSPSPVRQPAHWAGRSTSASSGAAASRAQTVSSFSARPRAETRVRDGCRELRWAASSPLSATALRKDEPMLRR